MLIILGFDVGGVFGYLLDEGVVMVLGLCGGLDLFLEMFGEFGEFFGDVGIDFYEVGEKFFVEFFDVVFEVFFGEFIDGVVDGIGGDEVGVVVFGVGSIEIVIYGDVDFGFV